jgi:hypothetical protein
MKTVVFGLLCVVAACAAEGTSTLTREQAKALTRSANTPAQHLMLAEYYRAESQRLNAESQEYATRAAEYDGNSLIPFRPVPKNPTSGTHYRALSARYLNDANKAAELATAQERLAQ